MCLSDFRNCKTLWTGCGWVQLYFVMDHCTTKRFTALESLSTCLIDVDTLVFGATKNLKTLFIYRECHNFIHKSSGKHFSTIFNSSLKTHKLLFPDEISNKHSLFPWYLRLEPILEGKWPPYLPWMSDYYKILFSFVLIFYTLQYVFSWTQWLIWGRRSFRTGFRWQRYLDKVDF